MNVSVWQETGKRGLASRPNLSLLSLLPPLLMKPSLTNADECRLVNIVERQEGRGRLSSSLLLLLNLPADLRKMSIAALTQFTVLARRRRWGQARHELTYQKSCCGVTVSCYKAAGMTVMFSSEPSVLPGMHTVVSFPSLYQAIKRSGVDKMLLVQYSIYDVYTFILKYIKGS